MENRDLGESIFNKIVEVRDLTQAKMQAVLTEAILSASTTDEVKENLDKLISILKGNGDGFVD